MSERIEAALTEKEWGDLRRFPVPNEPNEWQALPPHKLAALALYGQPFGFNRRDVEMLREQVEVGRDEGASQEWLSDMKSLADRVEALLPPDKPSEETE